MAFDHQNPDNRARLAKALANVYSKRDKARRRRQNLIDIYQDSDDMLNYLDTSSHSTNDLGTLLNLFQQFVKGHLITLAFNNPKFSVNARTLSGRGLDQRIEQMLDAYMDILNFNTVQKQLALDSAFGWAVCKVVDGPPPKGITSVVAPRVYRIPPDNFIVDPSAASFEEATFSADLYLVDLEEAKQFEGYDPVLRETLRPFTDVSSTSRTVPEDFSADEVFIVPYTRLVDVYIPTTSTLYTYAANTDSFEQIASQEPLRVVQVPINPYVVASLLNIPNQLTEIARLSALRGLHLITNEFLIKGVEQARASQRNPVGPLGSEQDMTTALNAGDNNPIFLEKPKELDIFTVPGPDAAILNLSQLTASLFSSQAGNLEVALGQSTGASTARQTDALLSQINAAQAIDRTTFENFLAEIGRRLATLAFHSEVLEVESILSIPGTRIQVTRMWGPPEQLPRVAGVDSFRFEVVPFSTQLRTPEERLGQLQTASQMFIQWMGAKAQGLPINTEAVIRSIGKGFDLVPEFQEWWTGEDPTTIEKTASTYQSLAAPPQGSDIRYQGSGRSVAPENLAEGGGLSSNDSV